MADLAQAIIASTEELRAAVSASPGSVQTIAARAGLHRVTLHHWLRGRRQLSPSTLDRLARALGKNLSAQVRLD